MLQRTNAFGAAMYKESFDKLRKEQPFLNLNDAIYTFLLNEIVNMHIPPGTVLSETSLADDFNCSRTPVRTALLKVQDSQLVSEAARGYIVNPVSSDEILKLLDVRAAMESYAAYLAAMRITAEELEQLDECRRAYKTAFLKRDYDSLAINDQHFHHMIIVGAHNEILEDSYRNVEPRISHYRYYNNHVSSPSVLNRVYEACVRQHDTIYNAIRLGFRDTAREAALQNILEMNNIIVQWNM